MTREQLEAATAAYLSKGGEIKVLPSIPDNPNLISNRSILERVMSKDVDHKVSVDAEEFRGIGEHAVYLPSESAFKV